MYNSAPWRKELFAELIILHHGVRRLSIVAIFYSNLNDAVDGFGDNFMHVTMVGNDGHQCNYKSNCESPGDPLEHNTLYVYTIKYCFICISGNLNLQLYEN